MHPHRQGAWRNAERSVLEGVSMFYDERIEAVKGRLCHHALVIALCFSLPYGVLRFINVYMHTSGGVYFSTVILEALIAAGSALALAVGAILKRSAFSDERTRGNRLRYYQTAAKWLIALAVTAYALYLPYAEQLKRPHNYSDAGFASVLTVLVLLIGTYTVYTFRREDIYFNYSLMESDRYVTGVFKNIGKLALATVALLFLSFLSLFIIDPTALTRTDLIETLFVKYLALLLSLSVIYGFYSFLERESYCRRRFFSPSVMITLVLTILLRAVLTAITHYIMQLAVSSPVALSLITLNSALSTVTSYALLIFLTYFHYEYRQQSENRLLGIAVNTVLLTVTLSTALGQLLGSVTNLLIPILLASDQSHLVSETIGSVSLTVAITRSIAEMVAFILGLTALYRDKKLHQAHFLSLGILAVLSGIGVFLSTQTDAFTMSLYENAIELSLLVYLAVLIFLIGKKHHVST